MPPHRPTLAHSLPGPARAVKLMIIASVMVLAGCAAGTNGGHAELSDDGLDTYLASTRSDPLGAYLRAYERRQYPATPTGTRAMASTALSFLGIKYSYGGEAPSTGFDCSGLVIYAAEKSLGLKLPRRSAEIAREGVSIKQSELRKGDLVFFNTLGHRYSHVGIYLGDRKFVHAPRAGSVVRIEDMDMTYWRKRYNGARRLMASFEQASQ